MADAQLTETVMEMAGAVGKEGFLRQQQAILDRPDSRGSLAQIGCQTLVLCGCQDQLTPVELHEEMAAEVVNARLVVIEDCGHLTTLERPEQVTEAMATWLQQV